MADIVFIAVTLAFFAVCVAYVRGLDRLVRGAGGARGDHEAEAASAEVARDRRQHHRPRSSPCCWPVFLVAALLFPERF